MKKDYWEMSFVEKSNYWKKQSNVITHNGYICKLPQGKIIVAGKFNSFYIYEYGFSVIDRSLVLDISFTDFVELCQKEYLKGGEKGLHDYINAED